MGLVLTIDEIHTHLTELGLMSPELEETLVYAQVTPSAGSLFLFGAYAQMLKGAYFVMGLEKERIVLIPLNKISGKIDKKLEPIFIPHEELDGVFIKRGKIQHSVTFLGEDQELPLKLGNIVMGMKWHKEHLQHTLGELEKLQKVVGDGAV